MRAHKKPGIGDRGKWAEKQVQDLLENLNSKVSAFAFERLPDARAARGALKAQVSDFLVWWNKDHFPLEVKETVHDYRLEKGKLDQLPRLRKIYKAGFDGVVLVHHSTLQKWRVMSTIYFEGDIPPSWDLSKVPLHPDATTALLSTGRFPRIG